MLSIGINNNVVLGTPSINEQGTLVVVFKSLGDDPEAAAVLKAKLEANPFADWDEGGYTEGDGSELKLLIFPFDSKPTQSEPDKKPTADDMKNRIDSVRAPLYQILDYFIPHKDQNPMKTTAVFNKTGIDGPNFKDKIFSEAVQKKVYDNIVHTFIEGITPFVDKPDRAFRLKLTRQSKKKAYPTLPTRFLKDNPFIESMKIPETASKLKFSSWEIANGYNDPTPISQDTSDKISSADKVKEAAPDPFANQ